MSQQNKIRAWFAKGAPELELVTRGDGVVKTRDQHQHVIAFHIGGQLDRVGADDILQAFINLLIAQIMATTDAIPISSQAEFVGGPHHPRQRAARQVDDMNFHPRFHRSQCRVDNCAVADSKGGDTVRVHTGLFQQPVQGLTVADDGGVEGIFHLRKGSVRVKFETGAFDDGRMITAAREDPRTIVHDDGVTASDRGDQDKGARSGQFRREPNDLNWLRTAWLE